MNRRTFFRTSAVASAAALNFCYPGITQVFASTPLIPSRGEDVSMGEDIDPNFMSGKVMEVRSQGLILDNGETVRAVRTSSSTSVWKEIDVSVGDIHVQDYIDTRGTALKDGSLQAEQIWVNIGRTNGVIKKLPPGPLSEINLADKPEMIITTLRGRERLIEMSPYLEMLTLQKGAIQPSSIQVMNIGDTVGAVGLRLPSGKLRVTRMWVTKS